MPKRISEEELLLTLANELEQFEADTQQAREENDADEIEELKSEIEEWQTNLKSALASLTASKQVNSLLRKTAKLLTLLNLWLHNNPTQETEPPQEPLKNSSEPVLNPPQDLETIQTPTNTPDQQISPEAQPQTEPEANPITESEPARPVDAPVRTTEPARKRKRI